VSLSIGGASHGTEVGQLHLEGRQHLSIRVLGETDPRNRPTTASGAVIRGIQGEMRWIIGPAAPPDSAAPPDPPHLKYWLHMLHRPSLPIKGTSHLLDWTHSTGASPFPSFVHLE
jgi:hypothetical protein